MPQWRLVWIAEYTNIEAVREKLGSKYGIDVDELKSHTVCNTRLLGYEDFSYKHGLRTVIHVKVDHDKTIKAFIQSVDKENNLWLIKTAIYI
jgi:hypothetical protein